VVGGEPELALLLHIFPEGVEELDGAYAVYADEPPLGFDVLEAEDLEEGWEDAWRGFHHGLRVGRLWVGPPGNCLRQFPIFRRASTALPATLPAARTRSRMQWLW